MAGNAIPKSKPIRSQKLRDAANDAPHCMNQSCRATNHGQVVGCHPNGIKHGKGVSQKGHDMLALLCDKCHALLDGRAGNLTPIQKEHLFLDAFYWSEVWRITNGYLEVKK